MTVWPRVAPCLHVHPEDRVIFRICQRARDHGGVHSTEPEHRYAEGDRWANDDEGRAA